MKNISKKIIILVFLLSILTSNSYANCHCGYSGGNNPISGGDWNVTFDANATNIGFNVQMEF